MSRWMSSHAAKATITNDTSFTIAVGKGGSTIRPTKADELKGYVVIPLDSLPQNALYLTEATVDFFSQTAWVNSLVILSGRDQIVKKKRLRETGNFTVDANNVKAGQDGKGLASMVEVEFENIHGRIEFHSVGLKFSVAPEGVKFDSGAGNVMDVRPLNQPRAHGDQCALGVVRVDDVDRALASDPKTFRRDLAELAGDMTNRNLGFMNHRMPRYYKFLQNHNLRHPTHWAKSQENQIFDGYNPSSAEEGCGYWERDARERLRAYRALAFMKSNAEGHGTAYLAADTVLRILDYVEHQG